MPIKMDIQRENRLLIFTYTDPFSVGELNEAMAKAMAVVEMANGLVYGIHDGSHVRNLPRNLLSFASRNGKTNLKHQHSGPVIVIAPSMFLHAVVSAVARIMPPERLFVVASMEEAIAKVDELMAKEAQPEA